MRYKYEFESDNDFEVGCCYDCPLGYIDWNDDYGDVHCVLHAKYDECPLEKVE